MIWATRGVLVKNHDIEIFFCEAELIAMSNQHVGMFFTHIGLVFYYYWFSLELSQKYNNEVIHLHLLRVPTWYH